MKALITSLDTTHGCNPMVSRVLLAISGVQFVSAETCDVVFLVFITPDAEFDLDALTLKTVVDRKVPVIIFDFTETFPENFYLGFSDLPAGSHYRALDEALRQLQIKAYFKRELGQKLPESVTNRVTIYPIDWTLNVIQCGPIQIDPVEVYNARPIDIFMSWGYSSESRPKLMGELLRRAGEFSAHFVLTEEDLDRALKEGRERIFALLFTPHYRRIHISKIIEWQAKAKISISLFGAGRKCFRHAEASYNSLMAQQAPDSVQWSYPWIAGVNCMQLPEGNRWGQTTWEEEEKVAVNWLFRALRFEQGKLHPIYVACVQNNQFYHNGVYARDYLWPKIQKSLNLKLKPCFF